MKKLIFCLFMLFPTFILSRNPFNVSKKEVRHCLIQDGFKLNGIAEYDGKFGAVISSGTASSIVFIGDKFLSYKVSSINKDRIVLNSSNENKIINLVLSC